MWRLSANYHFPLIYPDWGFGNILYLQQLRANAFYDFTRVYSRDKTSFGISEAWVARFLSIQNGGINTRSLLVFRVSRLLDQDQLDGFKGTALSSFFR